MINSSSIPKVHNTGWKRSPRGKASKQRRQLQYPNLMRFSYALLCGLGIAWIRGDGGNAGIPSVNAFQQPPLPQLPVSFLHNQPLLLPLRQNRCRSTPFPSGWLSCRRTSDLKASTPEDFVPAEDLEALQALFAKYCDKEGLMTKAAVLQVPTIADLLVSLPWVLVVAVPGAATPRATLTLVGCVCGQ